MAYDRPPIASSGLTQFVAWIRHVSDERKLQVEIATGFLLTLGAFTLYIQTLVPSFLDGDQGEFQFMPGILGIPHPTGFPLYILLGHIWSWLPIGSLAYRMNLFSAFWAALTIGALYFALRRQGLVLLACLFAATALAVLPQYWQFATVAAVYRLHIFLVVLIFAFFMEWERTGSDSWLWLGLLAFGFALSNHLTVLFLAPSTIIFLLLIKGRAFIARPLFYLGRSLCCALPILLYLYFPLRGAQLLSSGDLLPGWRYAFAQGSVSPLYEQTALGFFEYVTGGTFFRIVTSNLPWSWDVVVSNWAAFVLRTVPGPVVILAVLGSSVFKRARIVIWLLGIVITLQVVTLQYLAADLASLGQLSPFAQEYPLASVVAMIILAAWGLDALLRAIARGLQILNAHPLLAFAASVVVVGGITIPVILDGVQHRSEFYGDRSLAIRATWDAIKKFAPEENAALMSHWGDLTPLWYLQFAEGWRRDLVTIHPPDDDQATRWLATGKPLYLAGPLLGWAPEITKGRFLIPWGHLVRVSDTKVVTASPVTHDANWTFQDDVPIMRVSGYDVSRQALRVGETTKVAIYWNMLDTISTDDYSVYLSLANTEGEPPKGFPLTVNWLPSKQLAAGTSGLGIYEYTVPWGTKPGRYPLQFSLYSVKNEKNLIVTDQPNGLVSIGDIEVGRALEYPEVVESDHPIRADFGRLILLGWSGGRQLAAPGDAVSLRLLWKARTESLDNLSVDLLLESAAGARQVTDQTIYKNDPSVPLQDGEIVRTNPTFYLPADLTDGEYNLSLRVRDASNKTRLSLADQGSARQDLSLGRIRIVGRTHSYTIPSIEHAQTGKWSDSIGLLGYALESSNLNRDDRLRLTVYWQALAKIDESYKVFVHLIDSKGNIWAQQDSIPGVGTLPTTGWLPREVITDTFDLAFRPDIPPGLYQIEIGFYNPTTGERLVVADANRPTIDHITLNQIITISAQ